MNRQNDISLIDRLIDRQYENHHWKICKNNGALCVDVITINVLDIHTK